jgi:hypothetical protein
MFHVDRTAVPIPAILQSQEVLVVKQQVNVNSRVHSRKSFSLVYEDSQIVEALTQLFHEKCAFFAKP